MASPPLLYIEGIKKEKHKKKHFIRSLHMYVNLDLSLRGLWLVVFRACMLNLTYDGLKLLHRGPAYYRDHNPIFFYLIKLPSGLGEFWVQSSLG